MVFYYALCATMLLVVTALAIAVTNRSTRYLFAPVLLAQLMGVLSNAYIESGVYIFEQQRTSYGTGATLRLEIYIALFWVGIFCSRVLRIPRLVIPATSRQVNGAILFVGLALLGLYLVNVILSWPPPLFKDGYVTRFGYFESTQLWPILAVFGQNGLVVPIILGAFVFMQGGTNSRRVGIAALWLYLSYMLLIGHKFGGLVYPIFFFLIPYVTLRLMRDRTFPKFSFKIFAFVFFGTVAIFSVVYHHYSGYSVAEEFGGPLRFILYRVFALQGHLWWGIDEYVFSMSGNSAGLSTILSAMPAMIRQVAPAEIANSATERGVQFAFGFPASAIYYFGALGGAVVTLIAGFVLSISARIVVWSVNYRNSAVYVVATYVFLKIFVLTGQGTYDSVLGYQFMGLLALLFLSIVMSASPRK